tara:strand:- start:4566 stop:5669 length:1104 start_codon:yes stop_codon:yes gene_type:complete
MASTSYGVNSPEAVKLWSKALWHESLKQTYYGKFTGRGSNSLCQIVDDTSKGDGDRVRCTLRMLLTGAGVQGDSTLEGQEEQLATYTDDIFIDQLRHAVRSSGKMSEQRIPFSVREEARQGLSDWFADRMDTAFFNQLCGYTAQEDTRYTGNQAAIAPDSQHHYVQNGTTTELLGGGSLATETSVGSASTSNRFRLTSIDRLITTAKTLTPQIRPLKAGGDDHYVLFMHPDQVHDLRTDATANTITWYDAQKQAMAGGRVDNNPIFTGALGVYNGVVLHESTRVTLGASGSATEAKVRRAVFCGAQAAIQAFGKGYGAGRKMDWTEELFDYRNQLGVGAGMISGLKKARYNGSDFGAIVLATSWTGA